MQAIGPAVSERGLPLLAHVAYGLFVVWSALVQELLWSRVVTRLVPLAISGASPRNGGANS